MSKGETVAAIAVVLAGVGLFLWRGWLVYKAGAPWTVVRGDDDDPLK